MSPETGLLFIHGTFGHPDEYGPMVAFFEEQGFKTHAVALPGHGDAPENPLPAYTAKDYLSHCRDEYETFSRTCGRVFVVGHSLGAMCALWLTGQKPKKLSGTVSFSSPYEHAYWVNAPWKLLKFPVVRLPGALRYSVESYTGHPKPFFSPAWMPVLYREATWLMAEMREGLSTVQTPVLLAHSPYDVIVPYAEREKLREALGHLEAEGLLQVHDMTGSGHQTMPTFRDYEEPRHLVDVFIHSF